MSVTPIGGSSEQTLPYIGFFPAEFSPKMLVTQDISGEFSQLESKMINFKPNIRGAYYPVQDAMVFLSSRGVNL